MPMPGKKTKNDWVFHLFLQKFSQGISSYGSPSTHKFEVSNWQCLFVLAQLLNQECRSRVVALRWGRDYGVTTCSFSFLRIVQQDGHHSPSGEEFSGPSGLHGVPVTSEQCVSSIKPGLHSLHEKEISDRKNCDRT